MKIAVLTLVKGRNGALLNLIKGLSLNNYSAMELIVVHMNEDTCDLPVTAFPIRSMSIHTAEVLPLAKARNLAIAQASAGHCIFLDVDCIPAANFISSYADVFSKQDILWSGLVRYLKKGFPDSIAKHELEEWSIEDPLRHNLKTLPYELFWSLNFGCSKNVFSKIGGFDENFMGYGAEDTDFSFMARKSGIELAVVEATAYHQPHPSYDPPLNHLEDIVRNAIVFYDKWGKWPMQGWLNKFAELGYISWTDQHLRIINSPAETEIEKYLKPTA